MRAATWAILPAVMVTSTVTAAATAEDAQAGAVRALVARFEAARTAFDPAALAATLAPDYEEVSPVGEVDSREKVLGFYAPALKNPAPPMTDDETSVRTTGDLAVVTLRKSFTVPGAATRSVRARYVARRAGGTWRMVSAQYTPIRSAPAPAKP